MEIIDIELAVCRTLDRTVIANQPAGWCGNPVGFRAVFDGFPLHLGDSHASVRTGSE